MTALDLDVHGVRVHVSGPPSAIERLEAFFPAFSRSSTGPRSSSDAAVRIELLRGEPERGFSERTIADQVFERGIVYNRGDVVLVDHHGHASSRYDFAAESGVIHAPDEADLVELGYLMIHSRLGVLLERRGFVRVHACGFAVGDRGALVLTPSGGGKSRLALALLDDPDVRLLGDDTVLLDASGQAYPFPHPIGISSPELGRHVGTVRPFQRRLHEDKWIVDSPELLARHATAAVAVTLVAIARRASAPPTRCVPARSGEIASALWRDTVVGLGLPQVIELIARRGARDLWRMTPSALHRSRAALAVVRAARGVVLEVDDPTDGARCLVRELKSD